MRGSGEGVLGDLIVVIWYKYVDSQLKRRWMHQPKPLSLTSRHGFEVVTTNDGGTVSHQLGQPVTVLVNTQPVGCKRVTKTVRNPPNLKSSFITLETSGKPHGNQRLIPGNTVQPVEKHRLQFHQPSPFDLGSIRRNGQHRVVPMKVVPGQPLSLSGS